MNRDELEHFINWLYDNEHSIQPFNAMYADLSHDDIMCLIDAYLKETEQ